MLFGAAAAALGGAAAGGSCFNRTATGDGFKLAKFSITASANAPALACHAAVRCRVLKAHAVLLHAAAAAGKWHDAWIWQAYRQDPKQYKCLVNSVPLEVLRNR
jgi:hypothetical protein